MVSQVCVVDRVGGGVGGYYYYCYYYYSRYYHHFYNRSAGVRFDALPTCRRRGVAANTAH